MGGTKNYKRLYLIHPTCMVTFTPGIVPSPEVLHKHIFLVAYYNKKGTRLSAGYLRII